MALVIMASGAPLDRPKIVTVTPQTGNSEKTILFDNTVLGDASTSAPGTSRENSMGVGMRHHYVIQCASQDVQVALYYDMGDGAWTLAKAKTTITAGATYPTAINYRPEAPRYQIVVENGATGPGAGNLQIVGWVEYEPNDGGTH